MVHFEIISFAEHGSSRVEKITVSVMDAAKAMSVSRSTAYLLIGEGKLRTIKLGRRTLVTVESIRALVEASANDALEWGVA
jgi:excisionase family DNA binding protein